MLTSSKLTAAALAIALMVNNSVSPSMAASPPASDEAVANPLYKQWPNFPQRMDFFPVAVFWQSSGLAPNAASEHMNIFLGMSGITGPGYWPEQFGHDSGELEAIKAANVYVIGGINTPYLQNISPDSVASVLALAKSIGAESNVIGYQASDEPACTPSTGTNGYGYPPYAGDVPTIVKNINSYDPTRPVAYNETDWTSNPYVSGTCLQMLQTATQATSIGSFDDYVVEGTKGNPYTVTGSGKSDFISVPNDTLYLQGMHVQTFVSKLGSGKPVWPFVESGSDMLGSGRNNTFNGGVVGGSNVLVNASNWSIFTDTWLGLTVSGTNIPSGTTITKIIDPLHAEMSNPATADTCNSGEIQVGITQGSNIMTFISGCHNFSYTVVDSQGLPVNAYAWQAISGNNIPPNSKLTTIIDATHAYMSIVAPATATETVRVGDASLGDTITVTGGAPSYGSTAGSDCVESVNLCVVNGNEYRTTPEEVNAEVWASIINGANGIEYFCHDSTDFGFCLNAGKTAAGAIVAANLTNVNKHLRDHAIVLNSKTTGICSMQQPLNMSTLSSLATTTSCTNGILTMATSDPTVPGMAITKLRHNGWTYLIGQSDRRSANGATFTFTLQGLGGKHATVVYDSNAQYHPMYSSEKRSFTLDSTGHFSDTLGTNGSNYQVKMYRIQ